MKGARHSVQYITWHCSRQDYGLQMQRAKTSLEPTGRNQVNLKAIGTRARTEYMSTISILAIQTASTSLISAQSHRVSRAQYGLSAGHKVVPLQRSSSTPDMLVKNL